MTEEVSAIEGVSDVKVDLVTGGTSTLTLTADREVSKDALAAAVDEAGDYQLTDAPA